MIEKTLKLSINKNCLKIFIMNLITVLFIYICYLLCLHFHNISQSVQLINIQSVNSISTTTTLQWNSDTTWVKSW